LLSLSSVWSSESHQACLRSTSGRLLPQGRKNGRVVTNEDEVNVSKLKLKKDVFGEANPDVTLEQILKSK